MIHYLTLNNKIMKKTLMLFLLIISANLITAQVKSTDTSKTDTSNLSKFLAEENKKHLDSLRSIPEPGYKADKKIHDPAQTRNLDLNKYKPYVNDIDPDDPDLEKKYQEAKLEERIKIILGAILLLGSVVGFIFFERKRKSNKVKP